jgi:hypothetical protein
LRVAALAVALSLLAVALYALAIEERFAHCPGGEAFSCATLVRPALRALGPLPLAPAVAIFAATETLAASLLLARGAKKPFARDVAALAALGAGFALGLQPLALLVLERACLVCLFTLLAQLALAVLLSVIATRAGAGRRASVLLFALALLGTGAVSSRQGLAQRRKDEDAKAALARLERKDARLVLVERSGCPHCEALLLDLLARPEILARLERTGLARRRAAPDEPAPVLFARDREGRETARETGFSPDASLYEAVFLAAER